MEAKSSQRKNQAVELVRRKWHLPKEAEVEFHELENKKPCKHKFFYRTSQWIECENCHWGLQVGIKDTVVDGHLYSDGRKII